jgi:tryptophan-rich sensory protein
MATARRGLRPLALNLVWTVIFFRGHSPLAAGVEIVALEATTVALVVRARPVSLLAACASCRTRCGSRSPLR